MSANQLGKALELVCSTCGAPADAFEVVIIPDGAGEEACRCIWPLPTSFQMPKRPKKRFKKPSDEDNPVPYPIHLPTKLIKRILWNIQ